MTPVASDVPGNAVFQALAGGTVHRVTQAIMLAGLTVQ